MGKPDKSSIVVKKHSAAIHCVNSLSLLQRKISNAMLYYAYHELLEKEEHTIALSELCTIIGYNSHNSAVIKQAIKGLMTTLLEWNLVDDQTGEEDWTATTMLASVNIKGRHCIYSYSPRLRRLFHQPSIYGKINLIVQAKFKSNYGLALYENCARYRGLPNTKWFPIELFRKLMGIPDELYPIFRDFKRRVIDKAVEEVNAHADISVEPIFDKIGQKVIRIKFNLKERLREKSDLPPQMPDLAPAKAHLLNQLMKDFQMTSTIALSIIQNYDESYIQQKIHLLVNSKPFQRGEISNVSGFLLQALKEDYALPVAPQQYVQEQRLQQEARTKQQSETKQSHDKQRQDYEQFLHHQFLQEFNQVEASMRQEMLSQWWAKIDGQKMTGWLKKYYDKYGVSHPAIYTDLSQFLQAHYPSEFSQPLSFEAFVEKN